PIGGITPANAPLVAQAGADAIAVITSLFEAPSIRAAAVACSAPYSANFNRKS
ncbi:thiamine phosphate synthase, partial [Achromobacter sp. KAs 3-5]